MGVQIMHAFLCELNFTIVLRAQKNICVTFTILYILYITFKEIILYNFTIPIS
jgi:hypothetical protein